VIEMRGADAYFLWGESRARHMHTIKVVVIDPSTANQPLTLERLRSGAPPVMALLPTFRRRPLRPPLGLGHPVWLDTPRLDADHHFRHSVLPPGSGDEALDELIGAIASKPLDQTHPLWELTLVEGLSGGRVAYVVKIHHAAADGLASTRLIERTFQTDPSPVDLPEIASPDNAPPPSTARLLTHAALWGSARLVRIPALVGHSVRAFRVRRRWLREGRANPVRPFSSPMTRFNRPLDATRVYAHVKLPLESLRKIKSAFGCTINDVYVTLSGAVLRRYLAERGELPDRPLSATIPVSARGPEDDPTFGNATTFMVATLGTDLEDPAERLRAVAKSTHESRALSDARENHRLIAWFDYRRLYSLYLEAMPTVVGALLRRPSFNVIVSNVRGPGEQLYSDGARVMELYSMGPLARQQGLNFTAWSYLNDFQIGVHACRAHVPDVRALAEGFRPALEELSEAADRAQG
jgi:diacylglycerol O-acyltransferase